MEEPLRFNGEAWDGHVAEASDGEERSRELVPAAAEGSLSRVAPFVDHQWMNVDAPPSGGRKLDTVRSPVGLDGVPEVMERSQHLALEISVDVDVDVAMRPGLPSHERIDSPASFEPEAATYRPHRRQDGEQLFEGHSTRMLHERIVTENGPQGALAAV